MPTGPSLDTLIIAIKKFQTFDLIRKISYINIATTVSLHYKIYKTLVELATYNQGVRALNSWFEH